MVMKGSADTHQHAGVGSSRSPRRLPHRAATHCCWQGNIFAPKYLNHFHYKKCFIWLAVYLISESSRDCSWEVYYILLLSLLFLHISFSLTSLPLFFHAGFINKSCLSCICDESVLNVRLSTLTCNIVTHA